MAKFSIHQMNGETAVKFHHELGPFDIYLIRTSSEDNNIRFFCPTHITGFLMASATRRAQKALLNFGARLGYTRQDRINFDDVLHILGVANGVGTSPSFKPTDLVRRN